VVVGGYEKLVKMHDIYEPFTSMAAQFSIPYVVCVALLKGSLGIEAFSERGIKDKKVLEFAQKVRTIVDPDVAPYFPVSEPSKVTVRLRNGNSYSKTIIYSKGTPNNPMSSRELEAKFKAFATRVVSENQAEKAIEMILQLDTLGSVKELSSLLRKRFKKPTKVLLRT
jgi:2-methylcitrate dehydratase PrpD